MQPTYIKSKQRWGMAYEPDVAGGSCGASQSHGLRLPGGSGKQYCCDLQWTYILGVSFQLSSRNIDKDVKAWSVAKNAGPVANTIARVEGYTTLLHEPTAEGKVAQSLLQHECGFSFSACATPLGKVNVWEGKIPFSWGNILYNWNKKGGRRENAAYSELNPDDGVAASPGLSLDFQ